MAQPSLLALESSDQASPREEVPKPLVPAAASQIAADDLSSLEVKMTPLTLQPQPDVTFFLVQFHDAYTFRQFCEFARLVLPNLPICLQERKMTIVRGNGAVSLIISVEIFGRKLENYHMDMRYVNSPQTRCHYINPNLPNLHNNIKTIGKKEYFVMYQTTSYPGSLLLHFPLRGGSLGIVQLEEYEPITYSINDPITEDDEPNIKVRLIDFCSVCTAMVRNKYNEATLCCYPRGARFQGGSGLGMDGRLGSWGDIKGVSLQTRIKLQNIKALAKLQNVCPSGIISIYCQAPGKVRLDTDIGSYGHMTIYLLDESSASSSSSSAAE